MTWTFTLMFRLHGGMSCRITENPTSLLLPINEQSLGLLRGNSLGMTWCLLTMFMHNKALTTNKEPICLHVSLFLITQVTWLYTYLFYFYVFGCWWINLQTSSPTDWPTAIPSSHKTLTGSRRGVHSSQPIQHWSDITEFMASFTAETRFLWQNGADPLNVVFLQIGWCICSDE